MDLKTLKLTAIHVALRAGCRLHAFRGGGALRMVEITEAGVLKGYGEHPHIETALLYADADLIDPRPYEEVHGKRYRYFCKPSPVVSSQLDGWINKDRAFECWQGSEEVIFQLKGWKSVVIPQEKYDEAVKAKRGRVLWENRAFTYEIRHFIGDDGGDSFISEVVKKPKDSKDRCPWSYYYAKTGRGKNFYRAMNNAFKAPEVEISDEEYFKYFKGGNDEKLDRV